MKLEKEEHAYLGKFWCPIRKALFTWNEFIEYYSEKGISPSRNPMSY